MIRDGRRVGSDKAGRLSHDRVVQLMVGGSVDEGHRPSRRSVGKPILTVERLTRRGYFEDVSFELRTGEILTITGLVGAGRTELLRCIFGVDNYDSGSVKVEGQSLARRSPLHAVRAGLSLVPEDRRDQALVGGMSVLENLTLATLDKNCRLGFVSSRREQAIATQQSDRLQIKAASLRVPVATLSGGNQQKVVIGRWLARHPRVLILDEPTKGIDVEAKAEIHRIVAELAEAGVAILIVTSELPEVLLLSDRALVMRAGRIAGSLEGDDLTSQRVMTLAAQAKNGKE